MQFADDHAQALELRLSMSKAEMLDLCGQFLIDIYASDLPKVIGHHRDDYDLIWLADGSAVLNIRIWREMLPPFRHAVIVVNLAFEAGRVTEIGSLERRDFSA